MSGLDLFPKKKEQAELDTHVPQFIFIFHILLHHHAPRDNISFNQINLKLQADKTMLPETSFLSFSNRIFLFSLFFLKYLLDMAVKTLTVHWTVIVTATVFSSYCLFT